MKKISISICVLICQEVQIDKLLQPGLRVTVKMNQDAKTSGNHGDYSIINTKGLFPDFSIIFQCHQ